MKLRKGCGSGSLMYLGGGHMVWCPGSRTLNKVGVILLWFLSPSPQIIEVSWGMWRHHTAFPHARRLSGGLGKAILLHGKNWKSLSKASRNLLRHREAYTTHTTLVWVLNTIPRVLGSLATSQIWSGQVGFGVNATYIIHVHINLSIPGYLFMVLGQKVWST